MSIDRMKIILEIFIKEKRFNFEKLRFVKRKTRATKSLEKHDEQVNNRKYYSYSCFNQVKSEIERKKREVSSGG